jgi:hypothetical protein
MKKLLLTAALISSISFAANAQDASNSDSTKSDGRLERTQAREQKYQQRQERYKNASPEQQQKMDQRHEIMQKLTEEQKKAVKAEMERHRAAMKQITGYDLVPAAPEGNREGMGAPKDKMPAREEMPQGESDMKDVESSDKPEAKAEKSQERRRFKRSPVRRGAAEEVSATQEQVQ